MCKKNNILNHIDLMDVNGFLVHYTFNGSGQTSYIGSDFVNDEAHIGCTGLPLSCKNSVVSRHTPRAKTCAPKVELCEHRMCLPEPLRTCLKSC